MRPRVLSIGRFDCLCQGGVQNDLLTLHALGGEGAVVATNLTARDVDSGMEQVELPATFVVRQIDQVFRAGPVDAIKIGRLSSEEQIEVVANALQARDALPPVVLAAGLFRDNGAPVFGARALAHWKRRLPLIARLLVVSRAEAEMLGGFAPDDLDALEHVAETLGTLGSEAVLLSTAEPSGRGGLDVLSEGEGVRTWRFELQGEDWSHRSRPALAAAIACGLGRGQPLADAVEAGRGFVQAAPAVPGEV